MNFVFVVLSEMRIEKKRIKKEDSSPRDVWRERKDEDYDKDYGEDFLIIPCSYRKRDWGVRVRVRVRV